MQSETEREWYPHSKNRAILNAVVVVLSLILALLLLVGEAILLLYYAAAAVVFTVATFYVKKRLYISIAKEESTEIEKGAPQGSRKSWLIAFLAMLLMLTFPLLLAGLLPPATWFIIIVSFTTGVGASEIIIYMRSKKR